MEIAGTRTVADWQALEAQLHPGTPDLWRQAYEDFYRTRIKTRYLEPIDAIEDTDNEHGSGFAIATLFCALVEFLESFEQGTCYQYYYRGKNPAIYSDSEKVFKAFFRREPFKTLVSNPAMVKRFYQEVRCGLVHEAQTKGKTRLRKGTPTGPLIMFDKASGVLTVYRARLRPALDDYFEKYRLRLLADPTTQAAFIAKWAFLCAPDVTYPSERRGLFRRLLNACIVTPLSRFT